MPALHWAITRSGTEMMNSGAPITGSDRRFLNKAGIDMGIPLLFSFLHGVFAPAQPHADPLPTLGAAGRCQKPRPDGNCGAEEKSGCPKKRPTGRAPG